LLCFVGDNSTVPDMNQGKINLSVGEKLFIQFSGERNSIKSEVVGFSQENFIIIRSPAIPGIRSKMMEGREIVVKLFSDGTVYGFKSDIINYVFKPDSLLFINYPAYIEKYEVREHSRLLCNLPVDVCIKDVKLQGIISDISIGGCRINIYDITFSVLKNFEIDEKVILYFYLSTETDLVEISGKIKNLTSSMENVSTGIMFQTDDPSHAKVQRYIEYLNRIYNRQ